MLPRCFPRRCNARYLQVHFQVLRSLWVTSWSWKYVRARGISWAIFCTVGDKTANEVSSKESITSRNWSRLFTPSIPNGRKSKHWSLSITAQGEKQHPLISTTFSWWRVFSSLPSLANKAIWAGHSLRKRFTTTVFSLKFALQATSKDPLPISFFALILFHWNSFKPSILIFFLGLVFMVGILKCAITTTTTEKCVQRTPICRQLIYEWSGSAARHEWNSAISASAAETYRNQGFTSYTC